MSKRFACRDTEMRGGMVHGRELTGIWVGSLHRACFHGGLGALNTTL